MKTAVKVENPEMQKQTNKKESPKIERQKNNPRLKEMEESLVKE